MKTLYLECKMGAAGDMLNAALLGLFENTDDILCELNSIEIPKVKFILEESKKCGIVGNHLRVMINGEEEEPDGGDHHDHHHHHSHNTLYDIDEIIENLKINKEIKSDIREVYELLAEAESKVHGVPVSEIHFHEVGNMDAVADITAFCYLMHYLDPDQVIVSPINVGGGSVKTAHGILPVPAPATALLLEGIPCYQSDIESELCTPTGAALIKYFAFDFSNQPVMVPEKIGYGMGKKDFAQANCVRAVLGNTREEAEQIVEISCNVDDMTPEEIGFAIEALFEAGAVEVYTTAVGMKKSRPGTIISCMCRMDEREKMVSVMFKNTTTIGIRENICNRYVLAREIKKVETTYGEVRLKRSYGHEISREKLEYDDIAGIARRTGKSIFELREEIHEELKK